MRNFKVPKPHGVTSRLLSAFFVITLLLGGIHEIQIGGAVLVVLVRHAKHQLHAVAEVARDLKKELTTWKADP